MSVLKVLRLNETIKGVGVDKAEEKKRTQPWDSLALRGQEGKETPPRRD